MKVESLPKVSFRSYYTRLAIFLASLFLLLFTVVDIRRGFLFADYTKVGSPSTLFNLSLFHLPLLLIAVLGIWLCYKYMANAEKALLKSGISLKTQAKVLAIVVGVFLIVALFIYRGVPASNILAAGEKSVGPGPMGLGRAIAVESFPGWLQPAAEGINYMLVVWHATLIGMLLGSLFLVAGAGLVLRMQGSSFRAHLTGTTVSLAQPFCSCCAAPVGSALYKRGASLGPMLAFVVSSPMLNITGLILASALLPTKFALIRILGGVIVGVFLTYGVSLLAARWVTRQEAGENNGKIYDWSAKVLSGYNRLFRFDQLFSQETADSPTALISRWMSMAGRLVKVMVPVLLIGAIIAVYIVQAMPDTGNNIWGVGATALFGTLLMVPTWTEIPFAVSLIGSGLSGIAAAALICLPAVSLPCLLVVAGATRSMKVALLLGFVVFIAATVAGIIFM